MREKDILVESMLPVLHDLCLAFNPLNPELNPICYLLALLAHHFLHVSRIRVKSLTIRLLMSYIYGAPILDVSRSYTTITRPEESYRLWCVVVYDLETSRIGAPYTYDISNLRVNPLVLKVDCSQHTELC